MEIIMSGLSKVFTYHIIFTKQISILICLIFVIRFIAAKRLPAWWSYSMWLILLLPILMPFNFKDRLNMKIILPIFEGYERLDMPPLEDGKQGPEINSDEGVSNGRDSIVSQPLIYLWISGAILFAVCIFLKNYRFCIWIRKRPPLTDIRIMNLLEECKERMHITRPIEVIITDHVKSPALFGYFHPRLLLPEGILDSFNREGLAFAFLHEIGHLKRHDIAVSMLITLCQIMQWFNPLVWLAFYQLRIDQETACDELVLSRLRQYQPVEYANAILGFLETYSRNKRLTCMASILESKTRIKRRLDMIVHYRKYSRIKTFSALSLSVVTGLLFITLLGVIK